MKFRTNSDAITFWVGITIFGFGLVLAVGVPAGLLMAIGIIIIAASVTRPPTNLDKDTP